jgi:hypothetical protein
MKAWNARFLCKNFSVLAHGCPSVQPRMGRGIHRVPKVLPGPPCPTPIRPAGRPPPKLPYVWERPSSSPVDTPSRRGLLQSLPCIVPPPNSRSRHWTMCVPRDRPAAPRCHPCSPPSSHCRSRSWCLGFCCSRLYDRHHNSRLGRQPEGKEVLAMATVRQIMLRNNNTNQ